MLKYPSITLPGKIWTGSRMEAVVNNAKNTMKISLPVIVVAFGICYFRYISDIVICNKFFRVYVQQKYNDFTFYMESSIEISAFPRLYFQSCGEYSEE